MLLLVTHRTLVVEVDADAAVAVPLGPCDLTIDHAPSLSPVTVSPTKKRGELSKNGMRPQVVVLSLSMGT